MVNSVTPTTEISEFDPHADLKRTIENLLISEQVLEKNPPKYNKPCSLAEFMQEAWHVVEPEVPLIWGWYLDEICRHLEAVSDGLIRNLIINMPPRFGKSSIVAVMWPCWEWTYHPGKQWLFVSYGGDLSERDSRKCRTLIHSPWYQSQFRNRFKLATSRDLKDTTSKFENNRNGYRIASSVGGIATGEGGSTVVIDDALKAEDGNSQTKRDYANRWSTETMSSRLNDLRTGSRVLVMQRLHEEDLTGYWLSRDPTVDHLCLPMEFEAHDALGNPVPRRRTSLGEYDHRVEDGELLCPERAGPEEVYRLKEIDNTAYSWAGQYQQRPAPREGSMFRIDKLETIVAIPPSARLLRCRSWDRASTRGGGAYTAGALLAYDVLTHTCYVEDMVRGQWSTDQREAVTLATAQTDGTNIYILLEQEPGSSGVDSVKATTRMLAGYRVLPLRPTGDKVVRAEPLASQIAAENIKLIAGEWNRPLLREMEMFPNSRYRDQVDAISQGFNFLTGHTLSTGSPVSTKPPARFRVI
jgi:predicted phage terminase large subunit-like protein